MVGIEAYSPNMERHHDHDVLTCGYSPVAIVSSIAVGSFMFFCLVGLSFRLIESPMPVVGSCSFTILRRVTLPLIRIVKAMGRWT